MSRGEVIEHIGDGFYRLRQLYAVERVKRQRDAALERLAELAIRLPDKRLDLLLKEQEQESISTQIDLLIPSLRTDPDVTRKAITELQINLVRVSAEVQQLQRQVAELVAEDLSLRKRLNQIDDIPESSETTAWCADYTLDLVGEVSVVDVNDEGGQGALIVPGFSGAAAYTDASGALVPREAQSGNQVYFNAAILPGVQKWRPRYRVGAIQTLQGDLCSVRLDDANSSAQNLDINLAETLINVPIQYMDCNEDAFEIGDRVLVRFFASGPQVIGFESNPRACNRAGIFFVPAFVQQNGTRLVFGEPLEDQGGEPINPPLGTPAGSNPAWVASPAFRNEAYVISRGVSQQAAGNMNWIGSGGVAVSWNGPTSRFFEFRSDQAASTWQDFWNLDTTVMFRRFILIDMSDYASAFDNRLVLGAAIDNAGSQRRLHVVTVNSQSLGPVFKLWRINLTNGYELADSFLTEIASFTCPEGTMFVSGFYFNSTGSQGVCTLHNYTGEPRSKVYRVDVSVTSGFSITQVYDREQPGDYPYSTQQFSWTRERATPILSVSQSMSSVSVDPEIDLPLYHDCDTDGVFSVSYRRPRTTGGSDFNYSGERYPSDPHPHPCAGQTIDSSGGNVYPETFTGPVVKSDSIESNRNAENSAGQIVTSRGQILAAFSIFNESVNTTIASSYEESALRDLSCGYYDGSVFNYSVEREVIAKGRNDYPNFQALAINGRDKFVAGRFSSYQNTYKWARYGQRWVNDIVGGGTLTDPGQIEMYPVEGVSRVMDTVEVFVDGQMIASLVLSDETFDDLPTSRFASGRVFMGEPTPDDGSEGSQSGGSGPTTTEFPFLASLPQVRASGIADASTVVVQNRRAVSVLAQDGQGGMVRYQHIAEVGDPASGLFERPGEQYIMHRLTVA